MAFRSSRNWLVAAAGMTLSMVMAAPSYSQTTLSFLVDSNPDAMHWAEQLKADFEASNTDIKIEIELRPSEGRDNAVKTRLATDEMSDVFAYSTGSLFQQSNPVQSLVDLSNEPWQADVLPAFKEVVTAADGTVRGAPYGPAMGGGILYNIPIYKELGLSIPKTWDEFMSNNEKIKAAGKVPVIQTFGDPWTSQIFVLSDFHNVAVAVPSFAADYTANKAKYATTPAAMAGFVHQAEILRAGYLNDDYAAAKFPDGIKYIATGVGAHYPMLTFGISTVGTIEPDHLQDVGFFAAPGNDASQNGVTTWMPVALHIPKSTENLEAAKKFVAFVVSKQGCDALNKAGAATGPYMVKGCTVPDDVPPAVAELQSYFQSGDTNSPALEFLSPVKGPSLQQITVQVGSGISTPDDGAALYDQDVERQAVQLGLPGW